MIERLFVKWFLNVNADDIELSPGVTTLVGKSFGGKSSRLRALWWWLTNRPLGTAFVGKWRKAPYALVRGLIDGRKLLRKRGGKTNLYKLDGKRLKAFGASPPRPVSDLANVGDLNYQEQGQSYFWFTLSKAQLSRELNKVVRLDVIDRALKEAAALVRKAAAKVEVCRDRLGDAKRRRDGHAWAVGFSVKIGNLEKLHTTREKLAVRASRIASAVSAISRAGEARRNAGGLILGVNRLVRTARRRRKLRDRTERLAELVEALNRCTLSRRPVPNVAELVRLRERRRRTEAKRRALETILHGLEWATMERESLNEQVKRCRKEVKRRVGATCPECGQPIRLTRTESSLGTATTGSTYHSPAPNPARRGLKRRKTTGAK